MREDIFNYKFEKNNFQTIFERFKARNYFDKLSLEEQKIWLLKCYKWLNGFEERIGYLTFDSFKNRINELQPLYKGNSEKIMILKKLEDYVNSVQKRVNGIKIKTTGLSLFESDEIPKTKISKPKKNKKNDNTKENDDITPLKLF